MSAIEYPCGCVYEDDPDEVELVARAMCRSELTAKGQRDMDANVKPCRWPDDFADANGWRNLARAAIAALRRAKVTP